MLPNDADDEGEFIGKKETVLVFADYQ